MILSREMKSLAPASVLVLLSTAGADQQCSAHLTPDYSAVFALEKSGDFSSLNALPGHTRSRYEHNWGLVAPESRVWADNPAWPGCKTAHMLSDPVGSGFSMYLVKMRVRSHHLCNARSDALQCRWCR